MKDNNFVDLKIEKLIYMLKYTILKNQSPYYYDNKGKLIHNIMPLGDYMLYKKDNLQIVHYIKHDAYLIIYNVNKIDYVFEFFYNFTNDEYKNIDMSIYYNKNLKVKNFKLYLNSYIIKYSLSNKKLCIFYNFNFYGSKILKKIIYEKINNCFFKKYMFINVNDNDKYLKTKFLYDYNNEKLLNNIDLNQCDDIFDLYCNIFKIYQLYNNNEITKEKMNNLINYNKGLYLTNKLIN